MQTEPPILKSLTPNEKKQIIDKIVISGILNGPHDHGDELEIILSIKEETKE